MIPEFKVVQMRGKETERGLFDMIEYVNKISPTKDMRLLEIGAYTGESTAIFCRHFKSVTTIDPFMDCMDVLDDAVVYGSMVKIYEAFCERMEGYSNYRLIKKTSDEAIVELTDRPIVQCVDIVYIDGCHQYEYVKRDILNYSKIVKVGGFVAGHDYCSQHPGVMQAVDEFCGKPDVIFTDASWLARKGT